MRHPHFLRPLVAAGLLAAPGAASGAADAQAQAPKGPPAYIVNEIEVTNPELYRTYAEQVAPTLAPFGGTYVVRAGPVAGIEGAPPAPRVVILAFPSRADALAWRASPAYQRILPIREASATSRVWVVDGLAE